VQTTFLSGFPPPVLDALAPEELERRIAAAAAAANPAVPALCAMNARVDLTGTLGTIACPTLVVGAAEDRIVLPDHARALAQAIPGATYEEVEAGHLLPVTHGAWLAQRCRALLPAPT